MQKMHIVYNEDEAQSITKDDIWRQLEEKRFSSLKHAGIKL